MKIKKKIEINNMKVIFFIFFAPLYCLLPGNG